MLIQKEENICAISSPSGVGAIAIIRVSGNNSFDIISKIINKKNNFLKLEHKKIIFSQILDLDNSIIDDVLIAKFFAPASFTGENMVEIYCHGSIYIQNKILQLLIENGCRLAKKGEFSQLAFLNGKMDLSQAEAIADLIASNNSASHRQALCQMKGAFKKELDELRNNLINFVSLIELELDFSDEDVEFANRSELLSLINIIIEKLSQLLNSFKLGNAIKNGIPVAIVGKTNVGKSSLLNLLLNEEKAIVSDIHGTTRDAIEDAIEIGGMTFRFIDTAGLRKTNDIVENLGIEKSYQKIKNSEIILFVIDINDSISEINNFLTEEIKKISPQKNIIYLFNKSDLVSKKQIDEINSMPILNNKTRFFISVKQNNLDKLYDKFNDIAISYQKSENDIIVTNIRHYEALLKAKQAAQNVEKALIDNISGDFLSQDIRECLNYLGEITGEITNDEILSNIFKNFCIGK